MEFKGISFKSFFFAGAIIAILQQPAFANNRHVTCYSDNYRHNYCRVDTDNQVRLSRELSGTCREGDTWGDDDFLCN